MGGLVTTIPEVKKYTSISKHSDWNLFETQVKRAGKKFVKPLLGAKLYDKLRIAKKNDNLDSLTKFETELLDMAMKCEANYALSLALPGIRNRVSNLGVTQSYADSDDVERPATREDFAELRQDYIFTSYESAEDILEYLEENSKNFPDWVADEKAFSQNFDLFVRNTADFEDIESAVKYRQTYLSLRSNLKHAERNTIKPLISDELFKDLKDFVFAKAKNESLSRFPADNYKELIDEYIKPVCVYDSLLSWLPTASVLFAESGLWTEQFRGYKLKTKVDTEQIEAFRVGCMDKQGKYVRDLVAFLDKNAERFPLYRDSEIFKEKQSHCYQYRNNNQVEDSVFSMF